LRGKTGVILRFAPVQPPQLDGNSRAAPNKEPSQPMKCPHCNEDLMPVISGPYDLADHATDIGFVVCRDCEKPVPAIRIAPPSSQAARLFDLPEAA